MCAVRTYVHVCMFPSELRMLQDRLFGLMDKDGDGRVTHEEYSSCIQGCVQDPMSALTHMANGGANSTVDRANVTAFTTDVLRT